MGNGNLEVGADVLSATIRVFSNEADLVACGYDIVKDHESFFKSYHKYMKIFDAEERKRGNVKQELNAMSIIDSIEGISGDKIKTPFGITSILNMSTGLKAVLNTIFILQQQLGGRFKSYVVSVEGLGWNAIRLIFRAVALSSLGEEKRDLRIVVGDNLWKIKPSAKQQKEVLLLPVTDIRIWLDDEREFDSIEKLLNYLFIKKCRNFVFAPYLNAQYVNSIKECIFNNEQRSVTTVAERLPYNEIVLNTGGIKFNVNLLSRLTIITGDSGTGKTVFKHLLERLSENSARPGGIEVFDKNRPLTVNFLEFLENAKSTLILLDDCDIFMNEELGKKLHDCGAQVIAMGLNEHLMYNPGNIAVIFRDENENTVELNYPLYSSFMNDRFDKRTVFLLTNRPEWSFKRSLSEVKEHIGRTRMSVEDLMTEYEYCTIEYPEVEEEEVGADFDLFGCEEFKSEFEIYGE